ncbi:MAG: hypothetical protein ACLFV7_02385 [Phycisphaerae bacterium]
MTEGDRPPRRPFRHGTTYYHFANPPGEWQRIFCSMKSMGIDCVRVAEVCPGWEVARHSDLPVFHNSHSISGETYSHGMLDTALSVTRKAGVARSMRLECPSPWLAVRHLESSSERLAVVCNHGPATSLSLRGGQTVVVRRAWEALHFRPETASANLDTFEWALIAQPIHGDHA